MSQVEKGEHRRSYAYKHCEVPPCFTDAAAAIVLLLYRTAGALEFERR